jgi:hypothetical protein
MSAISVPFDLVDEVTLPRDLLPADDFHRWHWRATLPPIPAGNCKISLLTSFRLVARPESGQNAPGIPLATFGTITLPDGPPTAAATMPATFWNGIYQNPDPLEVALNPGAVTLDGNSLWAGAPSVVRMPYSVRDHDFLFGLAGGPDRYLSPYEDVRLTGVIQAVTIPSPFVDGPGYVFSDPTWRSAVTSDGPGAWLPRPFPVTVDWFFDANVFMNDPNSGDLLTINWRVVDHRLFIIPYRCVTPGVIAAGPSAAGVRPRSHIVGVTAPGP